MKDDRMPAWRLHHFGLDGLKLASLPVPAVGPREVLVRISAVTLNFRDKAIIDGVYDPGILAGGPLVLVGDAVGTVVQAGGEVTRVRIGERVTSHLYSQWLAGSPRENERDFMLGGPLPGGLAESLVLHEDGAVPAPSYLSDEEAATLPTAALTAWSALVSFVSHRTGDTVLIQGTGGVALFATQLAAAMGLRVIVTKVPGELDEVPKKPKEPITAQNLSILVLGAGELGQAVLRHLCERATASGGGDGADVSVLLRPATIGSDNPGKRRDLSTLRDLGIRIVPGDLAVDSPDDLAARFRGFHTVVGCTGFVGGSGTQRKLARAVRDAGGRRYVPWQFGVDYDALGRGSAQNLFDEQLDVRDLLRGQSRTAWVLISTGLFTSFLFEPSFGVVDLAQNVVHALGSWDNAVTVTAPADIGRLTAAVLFAQPAIVNQVVYTAGDTITYGQLADTVEAVLGTEVQRVEWRVPRLEAELARDPNNAIRKYRVVFAQGRGAAWNLDQTFNAKHGIKTVGLERWARKNLKQNVAPRPG